jgi:hypothetical protein
MATVFVYHCEQIDMEHRHPSVALELHPVLSLNFILVCAKVKKEAVYEGN